ncbi:MAG: CDP-archaeol synthase [Burkholderiales bacterium]|nr:CDP-archaeol synthase [Burkholderiales bacterium]
MLMRLVELVWFMLPAYVANMSPPFTKFWRGWNAPIHERLFGSHKTVVGFALGVTTGVATAFVQSRIGWERSLWPASDWLAVGLAMGFGAMAGDAAKSFAKRRIGIAPGKPWIPFDQLDFPAGALLLVSPLVALSWTDVATVLVFTFVADIAVNQLAYRLGIRDTGW